MPGQRECTTVCVFANWSPFSPSPPSPLAEYWWEPEPRSRVVLHRARMLACVARAVRSGSGCVHLAVHSLLVWNGARILHPRPLLLTSHVLGEARK